MRLGEGGWDDAIKVRHSVAALLEKEPAQPIAAISGARTLKVLVDSGAAENVMNPECCPDYPLLPSKRSGVHYILADGSG